MAASQVAPATRSRNPIPCFLLAGLLGAGCATQDQFRLAEVQTAEQKQAVQALRADAGRSESSIADLRSELKRTQSSLHDLEVSLSQVRSQAATAQETGRDFLANLVAAREEQRRQLADSNQALADVKRRLADLDARLLAQQKSLETAATTMTEANRRLTTVEAGLAEAGRRAAALEAQSKASQEGDAALTRQLQTLRGQVDETRKVFSSDAMLKMMRDLQSVQRDTAVLRGAIDDLQHGQAEAATRARNQYLDLDSRIQTLKQKMPAHDAPAAVSDGVVHVPEPEKP
jgi:chromosome segregation ATPase